MSRHITQTTAGRRLTSVADLCVTGAGAYRAVLRGDQIGHKPTLDEAHERLANTFIHGDDDLALWRIVSDGGRAMSHDMRCAQYGGVTP
ncbi:hypothetical protein [Celeribacter sp.]|uniref:hypothetical protein n=1 Tax=Celeribacter sp. TaxID=1890673 RepID=UPI003A93BBC8